MDDSFRAHLILFSIKDQEQATGDALILLHELCEKATATGVKLRPILNEIAELSSAANRNGMASIRALVRNAVSHSTS
jgi:hypothetical protein